MAIRSPVPVPPSLADAPTTEPIAPEAADILQNGAFSGPQTLPDQAVPAADSWEQKARSLLLSGWEAGWAAIKDKPLSETESYVLDVSSLEVYSPDEDAEESVRQRYDAFIDLLSRVVNDEPERLFYASTWTLKDAGGTSWHDPYDAGMKGWMIHYVTLCYMDFGGRRARRRRTGSPPRWRTPWGCWTAPCPRWKSSWSCTIT